ncbi:spore germination protein [Fictibacillus sp. Mic-4]|uniref:spore germination protein n=1 Tax=Fictibacillus sp. Mic-4 TaxID=3132826 RepID=UPI003CF73DF1
MPSLIVAPIKITSVGDGTVNFGDTLLINPKSTAKTYTGSGAACTGDFLQTISFVSNTNTIDTDAADANTTGGF